MHVTSFPRGNRVLCGDAYPPTRRVRVSLARGFTVFFLFVKNERGTPLLEGAPRVFLSRLFQYFPRDSPTHPPLPPHGALLLTRAITREKLQVRLLFFPTFTPSLEPRAAHRCAAYSAFLFNCSGTKYGKADDSPHSLGARALSHEWIRVSTYESMIRANWARCFSSKQAEINHYRARLE